MSTSVAAQRAFSVRTESDGGQSISTKSNGSVIGGERVAQDDFAADRAQQLELGAGQVDVAAADREVRRRPTAARWRSASLRSRPRKASGRTARAKAPGATWREPGDRDPAPASCARPSPGRPQDSRRSSSCRLHPFDSAPRSVASKIPPWVVPLNRSTDFIQ